MARDRARAARGSPKGPAPPAAAALLGSTICAAGTPDLATGYVFHDGNANRQYGAGDQPLAGMRVANGTDIVLTAGDGDGALPYTDDTVPFVIKTSSGRTPPGEDKLPEFYYVHKPAGSPAMDFRKIAPAGPLPASGDFPRHPQREPHRSSAIVFDDVDWRAADGWRGPVPHHQSSASRSAAAGGPGPRTSGHPPHHQARRRPQWLPHHHRQRHRVRSGGLGPSQSAD